jgi:hypothetical protein
MSFTFAQFIEVAKLVGLLSAGGWTAFTFYRLQQIRTAELGNNKTLMEIEKLRAEADKLRIEKENVR